jgi:hypothetical protein
VTWIYEIATGTLLDPEGNFAGTGYSGMGEGRNSPALCDVAFEGPIPPGGYGVGPAHTDPRRGPMVMGLSPLPGTDTLGRDGFLIHGDNKTHTASEGCVILGPAIRQQIAASTDKTLTVTTGTT